MAITVIKLGFKIGPYLGLLVMQNFAQIDFCMYIMTEDLIYCGETNKIVQSTLFLFINIMIIAILPLFYHL